MRRISTWPSPLRALGGFVGVDPGANGAVALVTNDGFWPTVWLMPATVSEIWELFSYLGDSPVRFALLEKVGGRPNQRGGNKLTANCAHLRMALTAARVPYEELTPNVWQRRMGCLTRGNKSITRQKAQQLFPKISLIHRDGKVLRREVTPTNTTAEALLLGELARRTWKKER